MLEAVGPDIAPLLEPDAIEASECADAILAGIEREEFLILPHPVVREYVRRKTDDPERWLAGMRRLRQQLENAS
jgi:hypothetical protein